MDYPEYAFIVARELLAGNFDRGVLICKSGIGMSIAANRFCVVRAAMVGNTEHWARLSREHNDANVLAPLSPTPTRPRAPSTRCGGYGYNLAAAVRNPDACREGSPNGRRTASRWTTPSQRPRRRPNHLHPIQFKRVLAVYGFPVAKPWSPRPRPRPSSAADAIGYPGGAQAVLGNHHT